MNLSIELDNTGISRSKYRDLNILRAKDEVDTIDVISTFFFFYK